MKLNKKNKKYWFEWYCVNNKPLIQKHHTIPKHHGGIDSPLVEVTAYQHALLHKKIHDDTDCKTCYKSYKTLMGLHKTWTKKTKIYNNGDNEQDWLNYYYEKNNMKDVMKKFVPVSDIPDIHSEDIDASLMEESMKETVAGALETLSERDRVVLEMYFGLKPEYRKDVAVGNEKADGMTLYEIGKEFDLQRESIRAIKEKALDRLRHRSRAAALREYLIV